ncbi:putative protein OS=Streptomyces griseorubiginosus OX=67304 GN=DWG14_04857 PE=4 SV=1 [Streptomyces griseorubiginosus]|nr:hypothetical protein EV578_106215 [Streptomyces sp. BK205]
MNGPVIPPLMALPTAAPPLRALDRVGAPTAVPAPLLPAATPLPVKNPRCTPVPTPDAHSAFRAIRVRRSPR